MKKTRTKLQVIAKNRTADYCDRISFDNGILTLETRIDGNNFYAEAYIKAKDMICIYPIIE